MVKKSKEFSAVSPAASSFLLNGTKETEPKRSLPSMAPLNTVRPEHKNSTRYRRKTPPLSAKLAAVHRDIHVSLTLRDILSLRIANLTNSSGGNIKGIGDFAAKFCLVVVFYLSN